jgi:diacylglycerol kinase family enzyme
LSRLAQRAGRPAAWLALLAAGAMVVTLAVLFAKNALALVLALASLTLATGAGWVAVTRSGPARVSAGACAVGSLLGGAIALIALGAVDELIEFGAAGLVFAAATPFALRRASLREPAAAPPEATGAAPRRPLARAVLLLNARSGGGKVRDFDLVRQAELRGIEPVVVEPGTDLRSLAAELVRSADVIGMAGGDGSQAVVAQVAMERDVPYVCVPAGTRNHFALDLGLDRGDVVGALDAFTGGVELRVDLASVNGRVFVNNVSVGVYAEIVQSAPYRDAKLATVEAMLPKLLGPRARPFDLRFETPDGGVRRAAQLLLVSNNPYLLDRLAGAGSRPRLDTGCLGIVAVEIETARQAMELVSLEAFGQAHRYAGWHEWEAERFEVGSAAPVAAGVDGEAVVLDPPLRFASVPGALRVWVPPDAARSAAALAPGFRGSTLRQLWGIAAGREARSNGQLADTRR